MKNPVYYVWYELVVGTDKTRHTYELKYSFLTKQAETAEEMTVVHNTAVNHLIKHHGSEGLTVNITGMLYLRSEENKSKSKNDANRKSPSKKSSRAGK